MDKRILEVGYGSVEKVRIGDKLPLVFIGGPCAIENREHAFMMAEEIRKICRRDGISCSQWIWCASGIEIKSFHQFAVTIPKHTSCIAINLCGSTNLVSDKLFVAGYLSSKANVKLHYEICLRNWGMPMDMLMTSFMLTIEQWSNLFGRYLMRLAVARFTWREYHPSLF